MILVVLAVILTINLHNVVSKELFKTEVRNILDKQIQLIEGLYLAEVRLGPRPGAWTQNPVN